MHLQWAVANAVAWKMKPVRSGENGEHEKHIYEGIKGENYMCFCTIGNIKKILAERETMIIIVF